MLLKKVSENKDKAVYEINYLPFFAVLILGIIFLNLASLNLFFMILAIIVAIIFLGTTVLILIEWIPIWYKYVFKGYTIVLESNFKPPFSIKQKIILRKPSA